MEWKQLREVTTEMFHRFCHVCLSLSLELWLSGCAITMHSYSSEEIFPQQKNQQQTTKKTTNQPNKQKRSCGLWDFHDFSYKSLWTHNILNAYYRSRTLIYVLDCGLPKLLTFHKELVACPTVPGARGTWKIAALLFSEICMNKWDSNN